MARRTVIWHIGPDDPGTAFLADALAAQRDELASLGIAVPSGRWHEIEDQIWKHKGLSLLSTPAAARADHEKVAAGPELLGLPRWTRVIHPERVHVVATLAGPDDVWEAFLQQAGIGDLPRPDGLVPPSLRADLDPERVLDLTTAWSKLVADRGFDLHGSLITASLAPAAVASREDQFEAVAELLTATTAEVERLTAEVATLRRENARLDQKRRKHKRRLEELTAAGR